MLNSSTTLFSFILSFFLLSPTFAEATSNTDSFIDSDLDGVQDSEDAYPFNEDLSQPKVRNDCLELHPICSTFQETFNSSELTLHNNSSYIVTVDFEYEVTNLQSTSELTDTFTIQPQESLAALKTSVINEDDYWELTWSYSYQLGDYTSNHAGDFIYELPYLKGDSYLVSQSYHGDFSHKTGANQYAVDFAMKEGTPILAARAGEVVQVIENYIGNGTNSYYFDKANVVVIQQDDGTHAEYVHIQRNGAFVEIGDKVEVGEKIALSGNTGYSTGPHLHFAITSPINGKSKTSHPFIMKSTEGLITEPAEDTFYTSSNELYIKQAIENNANTPPRLSNGSNSGSSSGGGVFYWPYLVTLILIMMRKLPINNNLKTKHHFKNKYQQKLQ